MKTNPIFFSMAFTLLIVYCSIISCGRTVDGPTPANIKIYENKTGHAIKMQVFLKSKTDTIINIANNNFFKETIRFPDFSGNKWYKFVSFSDSVRVIFDDNKSLFYRADQGDKNAFYTRKVIKKVSKKEILAIFTFTESDYLEAE